MNTLTTWNPFRELDEVQNRLSSFLGGSWNRGGNSNGGLKLADWSPEVDIIEDEKEYLVKADLPEMKKEEIKIKVEEGLPLGLRGTQSGKGRERQNLPPHRALLRQLRAQLHPARKRRWHEGLRGVQGRSAESTPAEERQRETKNNGSKGAIGRIRLPARGTVPCAGTSREKLQKSPGLH